MARRITASKVNWTALAERVPPNQRPNFLAFKSRSDAYLRRMLQNPEKPPAIDWAYYQSKIVTAGIVDNFKKGYDALSIPYPKDTVSGQIDQQETEVKAAVAAFIAASNAKITQLASDLEKEKAKIPYSEMTYEEYFLANPDQAIDTYTKPTYWPHEPEDQIGYVDKDAPPKEAH